MPRSGSCGASFALMEACPRPIATATLSGHEAPAVARGMASLFFSDVVSFTIIGSTLGASKVSRMLDRLFKRMDRLAYLHGVQNVDVVGERSWIFGSATFLRRMQTSKVWPSDDARCRAVLPD